MQPGKYQTRRNRIVELIGEPYAKSMTRGDGSSRTATVMKGRLIAQNGSVEEYEWEESQLPNTLASFINVGRIEGMAHEYDLVNRLAA